jgi:hypothetical protein
MLKKYKLVALLTAALCLNAGPAMAEESFWTWFFDLDGFRGIGVVPVDDDQYKEECGSCHFAYQPGFLPARSWEKMLTPAALHNHFGEVADLDQGTLNAIRKYAVANASDNAYHKLSRKVNASLNDDEAPLRITEVRFIKRKHADIPEKMVKGNKDVKSLSNCDACHTGASKGIFKSDTVSIPNYPDY